MFAASIGTPGGTDHDRMLIILNPDRQCSTCMDVSQDIFRSRSISHLILWDDSKCILVTGTGVVRSEGTVCLSDIDTVRIWH